MRPSEEGHGECSDSARSFWVFLRTQARFPSCAQERPAQKLREGSNVIFSMAKGIASVAETGLYHEEVFEVTDRFGKRRTYVLEPNEFMLALTYEHVWIPRNLIAMVEGRSSYARVGLSMHQTAPWRWGRLSLEELTEEGWAKLAPRYNCSILNCRMPPDTPRFPTDNPHYRWRRPADRWLRHSGRDRPTRGRALWALALVLVLVIGVVEFAALRG